jgi:hypothetical protein
MSDTDELARRLGFVSCKYLLEKTGLNSMDLFHLKSYGIVKQYKTSKGIMRGYYTYESFKKLKEFVDNYKGYFGHPASLQACLMAFEKKEKKNDKKS